MKILFLAEGAHPSKQGGIETFGRTLKKMFKENLFYIVYEPRKKGEHKFDDIIEIPCRGFLKYLNKLTLYKLRELMMKNKIEKLDSDVAILNFPSSLNLLKDKKSIKKILVQHVCYNEYINMKEYLNNNVSLIEAVKNDLDYFVFLSEYDRKVFIENLNLDEKKAKVIRHSSEMPLLTTKKEKNKNLIMIARLENKQKRFDLALKAMKKLPEFNLNIYGSGEKGAEFLKEIIEKEDIKNVKVYGPTNQVQQKLDDAGIFIMTSDYEGYPIALVETMRRALPLVVRDTFDAAKDIVIDNGILLPKKWNEYEFVEAIRKIYDNYEYYSENSKKMGERHSFETIKREWETLFETIKSEV
ncbi:glycosyltransferase [Fusobacterium russii]|uniref:glycosyltransferase n=1 Tax=Fusobacterium russii TaxID=854 RepID=UPI00039C15CE|nr:glycosyltransferase [Fusobacterium russii]